MSEGVKPSAKDGASKMDHRNNRSIPIIASEQQRNATNFQSYLSAVDKYMLEWSDLSTISEDVELTHLRQIAISGHLKVSKFRSVSWAILLNVLEGNADSWMKQRKSQRFKYEEIKKKHYANPRNDRDTSAATSGCLNDDPLSQSEESVWNRHFCDQELLGVIRQDVVRTFPGVDFYRRPAIQELMTNVLFCYARENPRMCYRQGMHEVLAPVLFVMHCDQQTFGHIKDVCGEQPIDHTISVVLDTNYMEADSYYIFDKIMNAIQTFYHITDMIPSAAGYFPMQMANPSDEDSRSKLEVVGQLNSIRDRILALVDPQLHRHLLKMDIPLTLFGIRWLRLLFGREFSLPDLLVLWDAIFAVGSKFELINYIVVSMLTQIRTTLLSSDYTTCLTHLMKYPSNVDVSLVIQYAMHIKMPNTCKCPTGGFVLSKATRSDADTPPQQEVVRIRKEQSPHRRTLSLGEQNQIQRLRSDPVVVKKPTAVTLNAHQNFIQPDTTTMAALRINPVAPGEHDPSIVEGYREDSPELLRLELDNARAIMSITRLKLTQYLTILRQNIPGNTLDAVHQSMDGIEELCSLLQIKNEPGFTSVLPVERAFEANEPPSFTDTPAKTSTSIITSQQYSTATVKTPTRPTASIPTRRVYRRSEGEDARRTFVQQIQRADENNFEVVVSESGVVDTLAYDQIVYTSSADNVQSTYDNQRVISGARYEIPDDGRQMSRTASKILGDRKEVEMHEFIPRLTSTETDPLRSDDVVVATSLKNPVVDPSHERDSPDK